jgi:hypothetical protein
LRRETRAAGRVTLARDPAAATGGTAGASGADTATDPDRGTRVEAFGSDEATFRKRGAAAVGFFVGDDFFDFISRCSS